MKEFEVTITETLQKSVVVEADSKDDAIQMVEDMWKDADIILDSENFVGVEYESDNGKEIEKTNELEVLLVEPGQYAKMTTIEAGLSSMQNIVGGNIQAAYFFEEPVAIVCNEEGKINGSELNRAVKDENGKMLDVNAKQTFTYTINKLKEVETKLPTPPYIGYEFYIVGTEVIKTEYKLPEGGSREEYTYNDEVETELPVSEEFFDTISEILAGKIKIQTISDPDITPTDRLLNILE